MNIGKPPPGSINLPHVSSNGTVTFQAPINNGGYAFPMPSGPEPRIDCSTHYNEGMTLRDYFAGQALAGLLANPADPEFGASHFATAAYVAADAMLKAREGK